MKVAVIGSRNCFKSDYEILKKYIPENASEIVSGGAVGIDLLAKKYAQSMNIPIKEFLPDYDDETITNKKFAPILRNKKIVEYADFVIAFWDGRSRGTSFTIDYCLRTNKPVRVYILQKERELLKQTL